MKAAAPPLGSPPPPRPAGAPPGLGGGRVAWNAFVGTKECFDTMPVLPGGNTRTYHPSQYFTELRAPGATQKRYEGMLGGWMPVVCTVR